ncbi:shikimate dehydrogenase [Haloimpatiens lingqiaonensis]|uniref:shikimate dehydrogenase n=1 Tax=Haloimpatiens lingqiaonensis TaxID=1380675 RepID=UPI0010FE37B1|nr:shikimate dehydrogenase [Haloimpatiens lingqiaonensis]
MYNIQELRDEIDNIDKEIAKLMEKRMKIVKKIALYKKSKDMPFLDTKREKEVINKNLDYVNNKEFSPYIAGIFERIMDESKKYQHCFIKYKSLYGLLGEKLVHSLSPEIHEHIFKEKSINGYYEILELKKEEIKEVLNELDKLRFKGINVTIPYKVDIMQYVDEISKEAREIGAVNTVKFCNGKSIGYNTDYFGFKKVLKKWSIDVEGKNAVILGSGGAASMVYYCLLKEGVYNITIVTRNREAVNKKGTFPRANIVEYKNLNQLKDELRDEYIIVNTTPCGMYPNIEESPVPREFLSNFKWAVDLIYNPKETVFLKYAREEGIKYVNGLYMLAAQAVAAEEIWNEIKIEEGLIDEIYEVLKEKL